MIDVLDGIDNQALDHGRHHKMVRDPEGDSKLPVEFINRPRRVVDEAMPGKFRFVDQPHVRIVIDNKSVLVRPIIGDPEQNPYVQRFRRQWEQFSRGEEQRPDGMPVKEWAQLTASQVLNFHVLGVQTVEQVAALSDDMCQAFGLGGVDLRERAKAFLAVDEGAAQAGEYASQNAELRQQLEDQQAQMQAMAAKIEELTKPKPRGRKAKNEDT